MEFSGGIFGTNGTVYFFRKKWVKNDPVELGRLGRLVPRFTLSRRPNDTSENDTSENDTSEIFANGTARLSRGYA